MTLKIQKHIKRISLLLIILIIFLSIGIHAEEGDGGGRCEQAFKNCMKDAMKFFFFPPLFSNFVIYCTTGYIFCKKFLS
jgi:hypothetical protein